MKARKIIEQLSFDYPAARQLLRDNSFLDCLQEEVDFFLKECKEEAYAIFSISESGEVVFDCIQPTVGEGNVLSISLTPDVAEERKTQDLLERIKKLEEDKFLTEQSVSDAQTGTIEKIKLQEKIASLTTQIQELAHLAEKIKVDPGKPLVEQAQSILDYDIAKKKQKLLDKLLKNGGTGVK